MTGINDQHDIFQAIADPTRRTIMMLLSRKEMSIAEIKNCFPLSRTAVNKHLQVLVDALVVMRKRIGRETRYSLRVEPMRDVMEWISYFDKYWDENLERLKTKFE